MGCLFVQGPGILHAEPLMSVVGVVAESLFVLPEEPGEIHGAKLAEEDRFGFLIEFGCECHGSEMMSIGLSKDTISWPGFRWDFLGHLSRTVLAHFPSHPQPWASVASLPQSGQ